MESKANIALVPVEGDLDVTSVPQLRGTLESLMQSGCKRIILNMAGVSRIDSSGMALVIREIRSMRTTGGLLSLTNVNDRVLRSLRLARVVDFVPVSVARAEDDIAELDPSVQPLWKRAMPVSAQTLSEVRHHVDTLLEDAPLDADETFDAVLAIGEALGNAIDHTSEGTAIVVLSCYRDRVVAEITDQGDGFDMTDVEQCPRTCYDERGRGIQLMRLLSDSVTIKARPIGMGTCVRIVKLAHAVGQESARG